MAITVNDSDTLLTGSYNPSHTLPDIDVSGTDTLAVAMGINRNPTSDVTSWTFEGSTPTNAVNSINTNVVAVSVQYHLLNNAATTIVSDTPSYKLQGIFGFGLSGVDQTTPVVGTPVSAGGYGNTATASYTGTSGNMLLVFVSTQNDRTVTASSCTELVQGSHTDSNLGSGFVGYVTATGSSQTIGATWTSLDNWRIAIVEVKASAGDPPEVRTTKLYNGSAWVDYPQKVWNGTAWI
jgi:hypothetical protein